MKKNWYKKHGIKRAEYIAKHQFTLRPPNVVRLGITPLCGWEWVYQHIGKVYPEQGITVLYYDKVILALSASSVNRGVIRAVMTMAGRAGERLRC